MKFSLTTTASLCLTMMTTLQNFHKVEAMVSPYVTCCESMDGTYEILNTADGQSGFCRHNDTNTEELMFYDTYCAPPTDSPTAAPIEPSGFKYAVYAVNDNCGTDPSGGSVSVEFTLERSYFDKSTNSTFETQHSVMQYVIANEQCVYVGGTNQDSIDFVVWDSFVSSGSASCAAIGNSNDDDCNLLGIAENACVINIC